MKALLLARAGLGVVQLVAPELWARGSAADPITRGACRALGTRDVVQAACTVAWPTRRVVKIGVVVDGVHALSMLVLAAADPARRRPALISACSAIAFAAGGLRRS